MISSKCNLNLILYLILLIFFVGCDRCLKESTLSHNLKWTTAKILIADFFFCVGKRMWYNTAVMLDWHWCRELWLLVDGFFFVLKNDEYFINDRLPVQLHHERPRYTYKDLVNVMYSNENFYISNLWAYMTLYVYKVRVHAVCANIEIYLC